jgi:hypothetical protein
VEDQGALEEVTVVAVVEAVIEVAEEGGHQPDVPSIEFS